jgi:hypothetical protein
MRLALNLLGIVILAAMVAIVLIVGFSAIGLP